MYFFPGDINNLTHYISVDRCKNYIFNSLQLIYLCFCSRKAVCNFLQFYVFFHKMTLIRIEIDNEK